MKSFRLKIEKGKRQQPLGIKPRAPGLSCQCSAILNYNNWETTILHTPPNVLHMQVVLSVSVAHLAATQYVPSGINC